MHMYSIHVQFLFLSTHWNLNGNYISGNYFVDFFRTPSFRDFFFWILCNFWCYFSIVIKIWHTCTFLKLHNIMLSNICSKFDLLNRTSLICNSALLALSWRYVLTWLYVCAKLHNFSCSTSTTEIRGGRIKYPPPPPAVRWGQFLTVF